MPHTQITLRELQIIQLARQGQIEFSLFLILFN